MVYRQIKVLKLLLLLYLHSIKFLIYQKNYLKSSFQMLLLISMPDQLPTHYAYRSQRESAAYLAK